MRIGIMGDTHGSTHWVKGYALGKFKREGIDTIIQVGDFGIWPGERGGLFAKAVNAELKKNGQELIIVPGNHEDWTKINSLPAYDDGFLSFRDNIRVAPRGHRWEMDGKTFVGLGGAPSVDRSWRLQGMKLSSNVEWESSEQMLEGRGAGARDKQLWWPEEQITEEDVARTIEGGHADVFVAHDAPHGVKMIEQRIKGNPMGFWEQDLAYAEVGRERMTRAFKGVNPKVFLHGHYHFYVNEVVDQTHVVGLATDTADRSLGVLDTEDLSVTVWDIRADYRAYAR